MNKTGDGSGIRQGTVLCLVIYNLWQSHTEIIHYSLAKRLQYTFENPFIYLMNIE